MKLIIEDDYLEELVSSYPNTTGKKKYPVSVETKFVQRVGQLGAAATENDIRAIKSLHFEKLEGNRKGTYSVRVKDGWRIIFRFEKEGLIKIMHIQELSTHYKP